MSISIRDSIRWSPGAASEPTSTVVLTSPGHRFVDIRILKDAAAAAAGSLDWAFAGTSSSQTREGGRRHSIWRHVVDSRTREPETVVDEGDIFPQEDGRTLETGRMVNPATGELTDYEEVWTDLEAEAVPNEYRDSAERTQQPRRLCVVLEMGDEGCEGREGRGMVVCVGRQCQGVVRIGGRFAAERWLWEDGGWRRKYQIGDIWIPSPETIHSATLSLGEQVGTGEDRGQLWTVVEASHL
ncbi:hypothetical protein F5Y14DRAFT_455481 [Nemania sp. NC0429]|nr:hypothetical protein F5Y14DRAFT_455481 [Nemania sp. NC0429]